jgi:DNA-binding transcriptional LysR family regulator
LWPAPPPADEEEKLTLNDVMAANLLVRERGSGTRTAVERLLREAGIGGIRLGSIEQRGDQTYGGGGTGRGFLSVHACGLEFEAGLLAVLPTPAQPVEADWHIMHLTDQPIPKVAAAFQDFVIEHGQELVRRELESYCCWGAA